MLSCEALFGSKDNLRYLWDKGTSSLLEYFSLEGSRLSKDGDSLYFSRRLRMTSRECLHFMSVL